MNDYTAHEIHRLDQAYPDAVNTIDDLTGNPARKSRLAEVGPEVFAAELTRDLAASAAGPMSLAAWAAVATVRLMVAGKSWEDDTDAAWAKVAVVTAERDALKQAQDSAAKRIKGLRDYILGSLDEDLPLVAEELRNASIDLADALADLGHRVLDEDEDVTPRRPTVTVELPAEAVAR